MQRHLKYLLLVLVINLFGIKAIAAMTLSSTAFTANGAIPSQYTCEGENATPTVSWQDPPANTQAFALIVNDPDSENNWIHWVVYNIPTQARELSPMVADSLQGTTGKNSWGNTAYSGPCPPSGTHHYVFTLYALAKPLKLTDGADAAAVSKAMQGLILQQTQLIGTYARTTSPGASS